MRGFRFTFFSFVVLAFIMMGCGRPKGIGGDNNIFSSVVSYSELNEKIFQNRCIDCHDSDEVNFTSYDLLMAGGSVVRGNPENSLLYQQIVSGKMPKKSTPLSKNEVQAIYNWIKSGADNDSEPTVSEVPEPEPAPEPVALGTFTWINENVIQPKCIKCHSGEKPKGKYDMSTYAKVMERIIPSDSGASEFYKLVLDGSMPKKADPLLQSELDAIRTWIDSGAFNN